MSQNGQPIAAKPLAFVTIAQCREWLEATPLSDAAHTQALLLQQLNQLNRVNLPGAERLGILELLRKPLIQTQREQAKRFSAKPLPLLAAEQAVFDTCQTLWQALTAGYARCLESLAKDQPNFKSLAALLIERAAALQTEAQVDYYLAGNQPPPSHWRAIHHFYSMAERLGVAAVLIEDKLRQGKSPTTPTAPYVESLLLHAAEPHEFPLRQLHWICRWARRWAGKVTLTPDLAGDGKSEPLFVDLAGEAPAGYDRIEGGGIRRLVTTGLRQSLKKRLNLLQQGSSPGELQLGEDCVQPACGRLLKRVYRRWCKGGTRRPTGQRVDDGRCNLIADIDAVHYYVSERKPFKQPGEANERSIRRDREEMAAFGQVSARRYDQFSQIEGFQWEEWQVVEEWQMLDESAQGIHLNRSALHAHNRIAHGQLVALQLEAAQQVLLGIIRWAMVSPDRRLHAGIMVLPGRPEAIAVRCADAPEQPNPYRRGFLLPEVGMLGARANVILPAGWFKKDRIVEIVAGQNRRLKLSEMIDRGIDFDRASFEVVG